MNKLIPCPFCGSHDVKLNEIEIWVFGRCQDCGAEGPSAQTPARIWVELQGASDEAKAQATAAWNRRAPVDASRKLLDAFRLMKAWASS